MIIIVPSFLFIITLLIIFTTINISLTYNSYIKLPLGCSYESQINFSTFAFDDNEFKINMSPPLTHLSTTTEDLSTTTEDLPITPEDLPTTTEEEEKKNNVN
jgi:hypothetical protein